MEEFHKKMVERNLEALVFQSNLTEIRDSLHRKGVFSDLMVNPWKDEGVPERDRLRDMYTTVLRRGPTAFATLVQTLTETGHGHLARLLDPHRCTIPCIENSSPEDVVDEPVVKHTRPFLLPHMDEQKLRQIGANIPGADVSLETTPLTVKVTPATVRKDVPSHPDLKVYPMGSRPKGHFLLINNINFDNSVDLKKREGAEVDQINILTLFNQLGYNCDYKVDLGYKDTKEVLSDFAQIANDAAANSVVVCMMSHGEDGPRGTNIVACDGVPIAVEEILEGFTVFRCPGLAHRPKVFIFQTCRGIQVDKATLMQERIAYDGSPQPRAQYKKNSDDVLVAYSTLPGYVSVRDTCLGTWYIQRLCEVFMDRSCDTSLDEMFMMVDKKMNQMTPDMAMQTSCFEVRGFGKLFFNPGLYDDDDEPQPYVRNGFGDKLADTVL